MKQILIAGAGSYIGISIEKLLGRYPADYGINTVDLKSETWRKQDFSEYDTVIYVAGIAHRKETKKNKFLYYKVNRDLAIEVAQRAKKSGVKHFIIFSSMNVYGMVTGYITKNTVPNPQNSYGKSKLEADQEILKMEADDFTVAVLRPPMVYGKGCKGNYNGLIKIARKSPVFPDIHNKRSMIAIENLSFFVKEIIDKGKGGIFHPQNQEYVNTKEMVRKLAEVYGKNIHLIKVPEQVIKKIPLTLLKKAFGDLVYEKDDICSFVSFEESIKASVK